MNPRFWFLLVASENMNKAVWGTSCKDKTIFPGSPCDTIDRALEGLFENLSPAVEARIQVPPEDFDIFVVATRR